SPQHEWSKDASCCGKLSEKSNLNGDAGRVKVYLHSERNAPRDIIKNEVGKKEVVKYRI
ncbi:hypothetical protein AVEN_274311-1, partial [Araneus ventricosus]